MMLFSTGELRFLSNWNNVDVQPRRSRERLQIIWIRCQKDISVLCKQDEGGVNDIGHPGPSEQDAGALAEYGIETGNVHRG